MKSMLCFWFGEKLSKGTPFDNQNGLGDKNVKESYLSIMSNIKKELN